MHKRIGEEETGRRGRQVGEEEKRIGRKGGNEQRAAERKNGGRRARDTEGHYGESREERKKGKATENKRI